MNQAQDTTRYLIEQLFHEHGIDQHEAQFIDEAHRCADLIASGHTVEQALDTLSEDTVDQHDIAEQLRTFLYTIRLRMAIIVAQGAGGLSLGEADDLHSYLKEM